MQQYFEETQTCYLLPRDKQYLKNVVVNILSDFKPLETSLLPASTSVDSCQSSTCEKIESRSNGDDGQSRGIYFEIVAR